MLAEVLDDQTPDLFAVRCDPGEDPLPLALVLESAIPEPVRRERRSRQAQAITRTRSSVVTFRS